VTGRFTQEDPIGLAGGMNLYGFGDGDPVNFSDPFGLCPWIPIVCPVVAGAVVAAPRLAPTVERATSRAVSTISQIARQRANILRELGRHNHLQAARLERTQRLSTGSDHSDEISHFANGLRESVEKLKSIVGNQNVTNEVKRDAQEMISRTSKLLDDIKHALRK
jgi:uncharacterized protein RhaS with RHS repeats